MNSTASVLVDFRCLDPRYFCTLDGEQQLYAGTHVAQGVF